MERMPRRSRFDRLRTLRFPGKRFAAAAIDWILLLYLSYCVFTLVNHWYRALVPVSPAYRVPFPVWGWVATAAATLVLAIFWENVGLSIGFRSVGLRVVRPPAGKIGWKRGIFRFLADLVLLPAGVLAGAIVLVPAAALGALLHGLLTGTGISIVPGLVLWEIGAWTVTLGRVAGALALLAVAGSLALGIGFLILRVTWLRQAREPSLADRSAGTHLARVADLPDAAGQPMKWYRTSSALVVLLLIGFSMYVGWITTKIDLSVLVRRAGVTSYLWRELLRPDFTHLIVPEAVLQQSIGGALLETIFMALMATLFGVVLAFPLSFLGARNIMATGPIGWTIYSIMRGFFNVVRSIETIVWAVIFAVWVTFGPFAGVLALAAHTVAALGKLYSEQVESIDPGPLEAIAASGARRWQVVLYGVVPQIIPSYLAFTLYRWDINVRMSTIIGLVGGGGIGRILFYYKNDGRWSEMGAAVILIVAVVWLMDYISARVRERIG